MFDLCSYLFGSVVLFPHEFCQIVECAVRLKHVLCDWTSLVHVLTKHRMLGEPGPSFEAFPQVDVSHFVYDAPTVLGFLDLALHDHFISLEVLFDSHLMEVVQSRHHVFYWSFVGDLFVVFLRNDIRFNTSDCISKNLVAHEILEIRHCFTHFKSRIPSHIQTQPHHALEPDFLVLFENLKVSSDLLGDFSPAIPLLQQSAVNDTFYLLSSSLVLGLSLSLGPVDI